MPQNKEKKETNENIEANIKQEAVNLVLGEKRAWEDALVFVTDKVAFQVRNLIKTLRKNYWGIFDNDTDPVSGKKLTWVPLTEFVVDNHVKNADLDTKDFNFRAKIKAAIGLVSLVRHVVRNWLDDNIFGESLDETERQMGIDGSAIWKTFKGYDENGKPTMVREDVDILNAYFDFSSKSIQKAYRFTERSIQSLSEIQSMDGWINTQGLKATTGLHPTDTNLSSVSTGTSQYRDVWELWGKIPYYLITGKKDDAKEVEGHIVVSGIEGNTGSEVHLIETNPEGKKPYEEGHTKRIKGRWLARGPAESVMMLQSWLNMIVNIRKIRNTVAQLGIYKVKKGSSVSPQMLSRMVANGVVTVNNMDDIQQFVIQEAGVTSYKDEENVVNWAQKITSAFEVVTGEQLPSSTPATNALIQKQATNSSFAMFKKGMGFFLQRWLKRQGLPILMDLITPGEVLRMTGEIDELKNLDEKIVNFLVAEKLDEMTKKGQIVDEQDVLVERENILRKLKRFGRERFINLAKKIDFSKYDVQFYFTNEEIDVPTLANNLISALKLAPQYQDIVIRYLFDIMGLDIGQIDKKEEAQLENKTMDMMPPEMAGQGRGNMAGVGMMSGNAQQKILTKNSLPV